MMLGDAALPTIAKILHSENLYVLGGAVQLFVYACDVGVALGDILQARLCGNCERQYAQSLRAADLPERRRFPESLRVRSTAGARECIP